MLIQRQKPPQHVCLSALLKKKAILQRANFIETELREISPLQIVRLYHQF